MADQVQGYEAELNWSMVQPWITTFCAVVFMGSQQLEGKLGASGCDTDFFESLPFICLVASPLKLNIG